MNNTDIGRIERQQAASSVSSSSTGEPLEKSHLTETPSDPQAIFTELRHQILEIHSDTPSSILKEIYATLCHILPHIPYDEIPDAGFTRINRLLSFSETLPEHQFALAQALFKSALLVTTTHDNKLERSLLPAMTYMSHAIEIAQRHLPTLLQSSQADNPHFQASQLITTFIQAEIVQTKIFEKRMCSAINQRDTTLFQRVLTDIQRLLPYRCQRSDHDTMIAPLYTQARTALDTIVDKTIEEQFSALSREVTHNSAQFPPLSTAWITQKYRQLLQQFRQNFISPIQTREDTHNQSTAFAEFFNTTFLQDAFAIIGPPPCPYEIVFMGSVAREEICPYSDVELFLLIEDPVQLPYFLRLTRLLELQVISLGETPDYTKVHFTSLGKEKPTGFHLDKPDVIFEAGSIFVCTPDALPGWLAQRQDRDYQEDTTLQYTLHKVRPLGDPRSPLIQAYWNRLQENLAQRLPEAHSNQLHQTVGQRRAAYLLERRLNDYDKIHCAPLGAEPINIKTTFIHPLFLLMTDLSIYFFDHPTQPIEKVNTLDIIDSLSAIFDPASQALLKTAVHFLLSLRTRLHLAYGKHCDDVLCQPNPSQRELLTLTQTENRHLNQIHTLVLEPLYDHLRNSIASAKSGDRPFSESMGDLSLSNKAADTVIASYTAHKITTPPGNPIPVPFPKETEDLLKLCLICPPEYQNSLYRHFSTTLANEPIREKYIDLLESGAIQKRQSSDESTHPPCSSSSSSSSSLPSSQSSTSPYEQKTERPLLKQLLSIPNTAGYRQKERVARRDLQNAIRDLTTTTQETNYEMISPFFSEPRYLKHDIARLVIVHSPSKDKGKIKSDYPEASMNRVCKLNTGTLTLHLKQAPETGDTSPFFPGKEQGVSRLMMRLFGRGTSFSELVYLKNTTTKKGYFLLISQTVHGTNLDKLTESFLQDTPWDPQQLSETFLAIPLILPGDHRPVNFIVATTTDHTNHTTNQLVCIDNDVAWVKPIQKGFFGLTYNLYAPEFFLFPDFELTPEAIDAFLALRPGLLLKEWFNDLITLNRDYATVFGAYKTAVITPYFEIDKGMGGQIFVQFCLLQSFLRQQHPRKIKAEELLQHLVSFDDNHTTDVGQDIGSKYAEAKSIPGTASEKVKWITSREPKQSMSMSQSKAVMYQHLPKTEAARQLLQPDQSVREIESILSVYFDAQTMTSVQGENRYSRIEKGFAHIKKEGQPHRPTQEVLLQSILTLTCDKLVLSHCVALTDDLLLQLMDKNGKFLTYLDLRYCPLITETSLSRLSEKCPYLEKLYLSGCERLIRFSGPGIPGFRNPLELLYLQELHLANCAQLTELKLKSHALKELKIDHNPRLARLDLIVPVAPQVNYTYSPRLKPKWVMMADWKAQMERGIQTHTNPWGLSPQQIHELFDTSLDELFLSFPDKVSLSLQEEMIKRKHTIKRADLYAPNDPEGLLAFSCSLLRNTPLLSLTMQRTPFGDRGIEELAQELSSHPTLLRLNLEGTGVSDTGAQLLIEILQTNTTLLQLEIAMGNQVTPPTQQRIADMLERNRRERQEYRSPSSTLAISQEESSHPPKTEEVNGLLIDLNRMNPLLPTRRELQERAAALYDSCSSSSSQSTGRIAIEATPLSADTSALLPIEEIIAYPNRSAALAFGAEDWKRYFGHVEDVPLPGNIDKILAMRCPIWPEKRIGETHLLVLIPKTVNGEPFTLDSLGELIKAPKNGGQVTKYSYCNDSVKKQEGNKPVSESYWVLMTRDVLPGTRRKTYADQKILLEEKTRGTLLGTGEPPLLIEAAACVLVEHVRSGKRLYSNEPWTYTQCQEVLKGRSYQTAVGGFSLAGLHVSDFCTYNHDENNGLASLWKFF